MARKLVVFEIDAFDGVETQTQRYFSGRDPLTATIDGDRVQYRPGLTVPVTFGSTINAEEYGSPVRGAANGGDIQFDVNAADWSILSYHYEGREIRAYAGDADDGYSGLVLSYTGRVSDLKHTLGGVIRAQLSTTDASADLDEPLVEDLYDDTELEAISGKPKPELRGSCKTVQPVLIDETELIYQVSRLSTLVAIDRLTVGGVEWQQTASETPGAGQYAVDLTNGTVTLGSPTLGQEVRVDAHTAPTTTADLVTAIVTEAGGTVDTAAMAQLDIDAPYEIGWFTGTESINRLDALDQIMAGIGGYWFFNTAGEFSAGVLDEPDTTASISLTQTTIQSMSLSGLIPPAWRIRIEYARNWQPVNSFLSGVTDEEKEAMSEPGIVAPPFKDNSIKTAEPRAFDVPMIRSLVQTEEDAIDIRDRLIRAWSVPRRIYDVTANVSAPDLYDTVAVSLQMVSGNFRVHSVVNSLGGDPVQLRLWGESGIAGVLTPTTTTDNDNLSADNDRRTVDEAA